MGLFEQFPYSNFHELNAEWLLKKMKELETAMETFKATESLKFADPIIWDITTQYQKSTIVLDPTGNAYLSVQPVPAGVQLNDEEYWLEIFNFTEYTRTANQNLTVNTETNTTRATADYQVDDWLIWNDVLYKVTSAIAIDDALIVAPAAGSNIIHFTVEDFCKAWIVTIQGMYDTFTSGVNSTVTGYYLQTQQQINQAISGATVDSEVILARVGFGGTVFTTLKERIDSEVGALSREDTLSYLTISGLTLAGGPETNSKRLIMPFLHHVGIYPRYCLNMDPAVYDYRIIYYSKPVIDAMYYLGSGSWRYDNAVYGTPNTYNGDNYFTVLVKRKDDADMTESDIEAVANNFIFIGKKNKDHPEFADGSTIDFNDINIVTKLCIFGQNTASTTVLNAPDNFSGSFNLINIPKIFRPLTNSIWCMQFLMSSDTTIWVRYLTITSNTTVNVRNDWQRLKTKGLSALDNKIVTILGDSGTTMYQNNAVEITIQPEDVGVQLSAYITRYDVAAGLTIDGYTFDDDDIGEERTFTPRAEDVGKVVGLPNNYNSSGIQPWWYRLLKLSNFQYNNVSWSGSSYSSHEGNKTNYKTSYAWHPAQIRKCGIRTAGSMLRTAPDFIIIARGGNDWSHTPYDRLTSNYYDSLNWNYPANDTVGSNYGFKEAIAKTIETLRSTYPDAKIILCTIPMLHRINYSHFPANNGINKLTDYNDAIREAADFYGCGLIELDKSGLTFENYAQYAQDTPPVHPTNAGHELLAAKAAADIDAQYS